MSRVLVVKMSSLGDVVHALPAVHDACRAGAQIDWVVEEAFADIPRLHPLVGEVIPIAWRRWRKNLRASREELHGFLGQLREKRYDLILDSQGLIKSAVVTLLARGRRCGFNFTSAREPWAAFAYGRRVPVGRRAHAVDRQRRLFAEALGYRFDADDLATGLEHLAAPQRQVMLLHGTTWASKHWPDAMWLALTRLVLADGYEPVVTWGNDVERARADKLVDAGARMVPRTTLANLVKELGRSAAVIGVDSGISHLSALLGTPTTGLYGSTDPVLTGCRGKRALTLQGEAPCVPCLRQQCDYSGAPRCWQDGPVTPACFASLTPEAVWSATRQRFAL